MAGRLRASIGLVRNDFGPMMAFTAAVGPLVHPFPGCGVVWRISREGTSPGPANLSPIAQASQPAVGGTGQGTEQIRGTEQETKPPKQSNQ
jgi:hypothetical protein